MAVPKKKVALASQYATLTTLRAPNYAECSNCGELKRPHHLCEACGYYDGREVTPQPSPAA